MSFTSLAFLVFFVVVTAFFFLLPQRWRWLWLLCASCYFYMAFVPVYILILAGTIVVDYIAGLCIELTSGWRRRMLLILSIIANVGVLVVFKYYNFFIDTVASTVHIFGHSIAAPHLSWILPIGLSFHTFQAMSYTIEVYRGEQRAVRHLGLYALYVLFYPQLVAGPIERPQNLLPQLTAHHKFEWDRVGQGVARMVWGLFKKIVIADNLSIAVAHVYGYPTSFEGLPLIVATVAFSVQLYCDFSGYCDIALGAASVLGIRLMENFDRPFLSSSISEFWKRWHISLTTWFRDYLFTPLVRHHPTRWMLSLWTLGIFLVSGLWHGANWTYIVWGGFHGIVLVVSLTTRSWRQYFARFLRLTTVPRFHQVLRRVITFALVSFSFIFFRAVHLSDAWYIVRHLGWSWSGVDPYLGMTELQLIGVIVGILLVFWFERLPTKERWASIAALPTEWRWSFYQLLCLLIVFFGYFGEQPFIYFQF